MTTLTLQENLKLGKTDFKTMLDLYNFIVEKQIITEIGNIEEIELSEKSKILLEKSRNSSNLINI
ncbi:MAG: hypothetical protein PHR68_01140 [Candidatus Gracilibacteria bacterium]|nr:hypothetical protein [Candidatus Gracilibacteria bacterium]